MKKRGALRAIIADDHQLIVVGMKIILRELEPGAWIGEAAHVRAAMELLEREYPVDLLILDRSMPGMDGIAGLRQIKSLYPALSVVIHSAFVDQATIRESFALGAMGYIPKSSSVEEIRQALRLVLMGRVYLPPLFDGQSDFPPAEAGDVNSSELPGLTSRQNEVFRCLEQGMSNKEIARVLECAENTVRNHVSAILKVLEVNSRVKAIEAVRRQRLGIPKGRL